MMNLILATYYSNYKNRVEKTINDFIEDREDHLITKFKQYDFHKKGYLTAQQCKDLLVDVLKIKEKKSSVKIVNIGKHRISEFFKNWVLDINFTLFR